MHPLRQSLATASPPVASAPPAPTTHAVAYTGPTGALFALYFKNLLLSIVTLGVYRFWAKTRLRQFLWGHTSFDGEPFEYTGTGKELFIGFLKAVGILTPIFIVLELVGVLVAGEEAGKAVGLLQGLLVLVLMYVGTYAARRYRMSRTLWRGIRFEQTGTPWRYAALATKGIFLNLISLGFYYPFMQVELSRYETENLRYGSKTFQFTGRAQTLLRKYVFCWIAFIAIIPAFIVFMATMQASFDLKNMPQFTLGLSTIPVLIAAVLGGLMFWYKAYFHRFSAENTALDGVRFALPNLSGVKLFRLSVGNWLLTIFTLTLLTPLALQRSQRFWTRHLHIEGSVDLAAVAQAAGGPRSGEGLAGFFNVDLS